MTSIAERIRGSSARTAVLRHGKQVVIFAGAYFVYMFIRKVIIADVEPIAFANATKVVSFELAGNFLWEPQWQGWAIEHSRALVVFLNWAYIITFWPIILSTALILYLVDRKKYFYYRDVILLSFVFALLAFTLFPLAPPRFLPEHGFVDAIQTFGPSLYGGRDMAVYYNAFAAMPSLHFSWTVLFGILFLRMKHKWIKPLALIYPTMTFFAITITGNHYILDAIGGIAVISASFLLYYALRRWKVHAPPLRAPARAYLARGVGQFTGGYRRQHSRLLGYMGTTRSRLKFEPFFTRRWKRWASSQVWPAKPKRT